jgi:ATP-dependent exoDNAse (exonuclease V) beta subunit
VTPARTTAPAPATTSARSDFGPLADACPDIRLSASAAGASAPHGIGAWNTGRPEHESARLVGTLVHRLFEQVDNAVEAGHEPLAERCRSLVQARERAGVPDPDRVIDEAVARFRAIASRPVVARLLGSGDRLHEVPFAMRRGGELVHGTIDTIVRHDDVVTVVEIKTGRPAVEHTTQLALYVEAAAVLFPPPARVEGVLVYPGDELWLSSP